MPRGRGSYRSSGCASRATRLSKTWFRSQIPNTTITETQGIVAAFTIAELTLNADVTVLRTRGDLLVHAEPDAAADDAIVGFGVCVVSVAALGVGGTSVPGPLLDDGSDCWLWHRYVAFDAIVATAGVTTLGSLVERIEIDSKAMRRLAADQSIALIAESSTSEFGIIQVAGGIAFLMGS